MVPVMSTGEGGFRIVDSDKYPEEKGTAQDAFFRLGEEVKVKDSWFRVHGITPKKLILRLLPKKA